MKSLPHALLLMMFAVSSATAQTSAPPPHDGSVHYQKFQDLKWDKLVPEQGAGSPEITILHVDPKTGATQLLIRTPKDYHAARHWHTANETHTVIYGTFMIKHDGGEPQELRLESFNYMPSKLVHEAWTNPYEGTMVFITVDGPWDLNLADAPATAQKSPSGK